MNGQRRRKPRRGRGDDDGTSSSPPPTRAPVDADKVRERTFNRAVKLLAAKPRSVAELRERLLEKEWADAETVEAALAKLKEYGYLDDERFAFSFASYRLRQKPLGRGRLARDLRMKKVGRETADEALNLVYAETPEEELIDRAIAKRIRLRGCPRSRAEIKSFHDHLLRLGFAYGLVRPKVLAVAVPPDAGETELMPDETDSDSC